MASEPRLGLRSQNPTLAGLGEVGKKAVPRAAFTLIELLVVMLLIVILAGITMSVSKYVNWRARKAMADIELEKIRVALDEYRSVYGEFPIVGDPNHYPVSFPTEQGTTGNVPSIFRTVDLVNTDTNADYKDAAYKHCGKNGRPGVEYLPFSQINVDYRLTYALKLRPESEGRAAFMDFPLITVCYLVWRRTDQFGYSAGLKYLKGDPVNRYLAVDPVSRCQWHYECSDGMTYSITNWSW